MILDGIDPVRDRLGVAEAVFVQEVQVQPPGLFEPPPQRPTVGLPVVHGAPRQVVFAPAERPAQGVVVLGEGDRLVQLKLERHLRAGERGRLGDRTLVETWSEVGLQRTEPCRGV